MDTLMGGDTAAFKAAMDQARQSGRAFTPAQLEAAAQSGAKLFDTVAGQRLGRDKQTYDLNEGLQDARAKEVLLQYGAVATPENKAELIKAYEEFLPVYAGDKDSGRYRSYLKQIHNFIESGGIKVQLPGGEIHRVLPSPEAFKGILANMDRDWANLGNWSGTMDNDIKGAIRKWQNNPENIKHVAEVVSEHRRQLRKKAVASINK